MAGRTVFAAVGAAVLAGSSTAVGHSSDVVSFRVSGTPAIVGVTSSCPDGLARVKLVSTGGGRAGSSTLCALETKKTDREGYAIESITQRVIQRDVLPAGTIVSTAVYVFRWIDRAGSVANVSVRGRVTGGTRRYANARGTISGRGIQRGGRQQLAFVLRLR